MQTTISRRQLLVQKFPLALLATSSVGRRCLANPLAPENSIRQFKPKWLLASCMYGYAALDMILPELTELGIQHIDLWPKVHGSQREELTKLGEDTFREMVDEHSVSLGCISQYKLGPFKLREEIQLAKRLECPYIVTSAQGDKTKPRKDAIQEFAQRMEPEFQLAADAGVTLLVENHGSSILDSLDAIRWLIDACPKQGQGFGFALAPAHLEQNPEVISDLILETKEHLKLFYAWQYGNGFRAKMDHEKEMLQMPGRGPLDFGPPMRSLAEIDFQGFIEVMMHPTPRGVPIEPTVKGVTEAIRQSHIYLEKCLDAPGSVSPK